MDSTIYRRDLYSAYSDTCKKHSDNTLFVFKGDEISYSETLKKAKRRAAFLSSLGYGQGDVIGILAGSSPDWCITFMAITSISAVALPLDTGLKNDQYRSMMNDAGVKAVFLSEEYRDCIEGVDALEIALDVNMGEEDDFIYSESDCDSTAVLIFTSGTTGFPKIVELSHSNILHIAYVCTDLEEYTEKDVTLAILPLFHVYALESTFMAPLVTGSSMVLQDSLKGPDIMKSLAENDITIFPAAPVMWELFFDGIAGRVKSESLIKYRLFMFCVRNARLLKRLGFGIILKKLFQPVHDVFGNSHRFFISGGAPLKEEYFNYYKNMGFNIMEGYGLTETTGPIAIPYYKKARSGSVGPPIPGNEVRIKNINEDGTGEIWLKGDAVTSGYYMNEEANKEAFDSQGCFFTGDLGHIDSENNIYIRGRIKNVIVLDSGKNIYPEEVEFYFRQSELISEIAVFERKIDNRVCAFAVIVPSDRSADSYSSIKKEISRLNRGLPDYRKIRHFAVSFDELPKNTMKKILYRDVISLLDRGIYQQNEGESPVLMNMLKGATVHEEHVIDILKEKLNADILYINQSPEEFDIDSLKYIELIVHFEEKLNISIDINEFKQKKTMGEIVQYLSSLEKSDGSSLDDWIFRGEFETRPNRIFNPLHHLVIAFLGFVSRKCWGLEAVNLENLKFDNTILVANHQSFLDIIWIASHIPRQYRKNVYVTGKKEFSFLKYIFPIFPVIYVDGNNGIEVLKANADILRQGRSVIIFPEGTRTPDGRMQHFKNGAAYLSKNLDRKIVPVSIRGAFDIWPRQKRLPEFFTSKRGSVYVGDIIDPSGYDSVQSLNSAIESGVNAGLQAGIDQQ